MQPGFWRKCRIGIRWLRRAVLIAVLAAICAVIWFDRVGLPAFLTDHLVAALHQHGLDLKFSRMRLTFSSGLVAENVHLGRGESSQSPSVSARRVMLEINYGAAWHRRLQLDGLVVRNGTFILPLSDTNTFSLTNIQTDLQLQTNDFWVLNNFKAGFEGVQLGMSGQVANGRELPKWEIFHGKKTANAQAVRDQLQKISEALHKIHHTDPTLLSVNVQGDARDIHTFIILLSLTSPSVQTARAGANQFQFSAMLTAPQMAPTTNFDASLGFWTNALPWQLKWSLRVADFNSRYLNANAVSVSGLWQEPALSVNLSARLGRGKFDANTRVDVVTREFTFTNLSVFDPHALDGLLTDKIREQLAELACPQPPRVQDSGSMILPAWTNLDVNWRKVVQPTIRLDGELSFTNGSFKEELIDSAEARFSYSNLMWKIPSLAWQQSRTRLVATGSENDATRDFDCKISGTFDPESMRPFLPPPVAARVFSSFTNAEPLYFSTQMSGRLYDFGSLYATGHLAGTNFAVHAQHVDNATGDFSYSNRCVTFFKSRLGRGQETMTADEVILDLNKNLIRFKNGYSTADPQAVAIIIGPKTAEIMSPYHFFKPPTALINGCAPLGDVNGRTDADLRFDVVRGAPFETHKFRATTVTGTIHWYGQNLILTNIVASLYGGSGSGGADFDFRVPHEGADYHSWIYFTNVDLHGLMSDLSSTTNHLQGAFSGDVVITHASTEDSRTVDGYGQAQLRDGLLWDIKIFGFFSKALNQVSPNLGSVRATEADGSFTMTNGVIYSDTLQITTVASRLQYTGTVDLNENVNARVTAQLLHNVWGVGPLISMVFTPVTKIFEYKVTGNLDDPKYQPVYVLPRLLLLPLHPIRGFQDFFSGNGSTTNAPAGN